MLQKKTQRILEKNQGALRAVQGGLLSAGNGAAPRILLVTSARQGEGKTTCAAGLAAGLARGGKVLLVEGNLRRPALHKIFGLESGPDLKALLDGEDAGRCVRKSDLPRVDVLALESPGAEAAESFDAQLFGRKLRALAEQYDYVVVDGADVTNDSEACLTAREVDGVVLVAECESTKWEVLDIARNMVAQAGGKVLGVILNKRHYYVPRILYGKV